MEREKLEKNIAAIRVAPNEAEVGKYTDAILIDIEQYANERVIEVLDSLMASCVMSINYDLKDGINKRINELKQ